MSPKISAPHLLVVMLAPLLVACPREPDDSFYLPGVPQCSDPQQLLSTDRAGYIICKDPPSALRILPSCKKYSEALTSDGMSMLCAHRNNQPQPSRDALNNLESTENLIDDDTIRLAKLTPPRVVSFCGQTANQPSAAFSSGALRGISAANALCTAVIGCATNAHMCSVYEMFQSVVNPGAVSQLPLGKAWVYMAAWSQEFSDNSGLQKEPGAGLADNCGGYTVGDASKKWYGTAVSWSPTASGDKALKFSSGPPSVGVSGTTSIVTNANAVACSAVLPIACCK